MSDTRILRQLFSAYAHAQVTVETIDHAKRRVTLATRCLVGDTVVLKGEAVVLAPSRKFD